MDSRGISASTPYLEAEDDAYEGFDWGDPDEDDWSSGTDEWRDFMDGTLMAAVPARPAQESRVQA